MDLIGGRNFHGKSMVGSREGPQKGSKYQMLTLEAIRQPHLPGAGGRHSIIDLNNASSLCEHMFLWEESRKVRQVRHAGWWPQSTIRSTAYNIITMSRKYVNRTFAKP